jgi:hypothetical protein
MSFLVGSTNRRQTGGKKGVREEIIPGDFEDDNTQQQTGVNERIGADGRLFQRVAFSVDSTT